MRSMIIDAEKLLEGIKMLNGYLSEHVVTVNFTKKDGTDRTMRCTRRMDMIPVDKQPKPKIDPIADKDMTITEMVVALHDSDPQLFKVWDLDKQAWRSFVYTRINSIGVDENTSI